MNHHILFSSSPGDCVTDLSCHSLVRQALVLLSDSITLACGFSPVVSSHQTTSTLELKMHGQSFNF